MYPLIQRNQYLLLKYGLTKEKWKEHSVNSNWLGFEYIKKIIGNKSLNKMNCSCDENCKKINFLTGGKTFVSTNNDINMEHIQILFH